MSRSAWAALPLALIVATSPAKNVGADDDDDIYTIKGNAVCVGYDFYTFAWTMEMVNGDKPIYGVSTKNGQTVTTIVDMTNYTMPDGQHAFNATRYATNIVIVLPTLTENADQQCRDTAKALLDNSDSGSPDQSPESIPVKVHKFIFNYPMHGLQS